MTSLIAARREARKLERPGLTTAKEVGVSANRTTKQRTTEESAWILLSIFKQQKIQPDGLLLWSGLQQYYWAKAGGNAGFAEGTQWLLDEGYLEQRKPIRQAFYLTQAGYDAMGDLDE